MATLQELRKRADELRAEAALVQTQIHALQVSQCAAQVGDIVSDRDGSEFLVSGHEGVRHGWLEGTGRKKGGGWSKRRQTIYGGWTLVSKATP